jgi:CcmD family protein
LPLSVEGGCPFREDIAMPGSSIYLIVAYAVVWLGLFVYLAVVAMRMRAVRTELAAVEELVREHQEHMDVD